MGIAGNVRDQKSATHGHLDGPRIVHYRTRRFALTQAGPEHEALLTLPGATYPPVRNGAPPRHVYWQMLHG